MYRMLAIDAAWANALSAQAPLTVESRFRHAINIARVDTTDSDLLWIASREVEKAPGALVLDIDDTPPFIKAGDAMRLQRDGDDAVLLHETAGSRIEVCRFDSLAPAAERNSCKMGPVRPVRTLDRAFLLAREAWLTSAPCISPYALHGARKDPYGSKLSDALRTGSRTLCRALCERSDKNVAEAAARLIGLGPGLTPSGDDFIVGAFCIRQACTPIADGKGVFRSDGTLRALTTLAESTTSVSRMYLHAALRREFAPHVSGAVRSLLEEDERFVAESMEKLLRFGASSGFDVLTGMVWYLAEKTGYGIR